MNIAGVLVHAKTDTAARVAAELAAMPGVEVHAQLPDGRLIVTLDADDEHVAGETMLAMHRIDGLLSAALTFHYFGSDQDPTVNMEKSDATVAA